MHEIKLAKKSHNQFNTSIRQVINISMYRINLATTIEQFVWPTKSPKKN